MRQGIVYIRYNRKLERYYIGAHWGLEDTIPKQFQYYVDVRAQPEDWELEILERYPTAQEAYDRRDQLLSEYPTTAFGTVLYNQLHSIERPWYARSEAEQQAINKRRKSTQLRHYSIPGTREKYLEK